MKLIDRLKEVYIAGYQTRQLEITREWVRDYEKDKLSQIQVKLDELRTPYLNGNYLERMVYMFGWRKANKNRLKTDWTIANS